MPLRDLPKPDMSKVTRYHDNSIDALIDEALDEMSQIRTKASDEADRLNDRLLRGDFNDKARGIDSSEK